MGIPWSELSPPRFFGRSELQCSHCGRCYLDPHTVQMLDELRLQLGHAITVNSGYRCPVHNEAVGGAENSFHMKGKAFDLGFPWGLLRERCVFTAARIGFTGIGSYSGFVHLDTGPSRWWSGL